MMLSAILAVIAAAFQATAYAHRQIFQYFNAGYGAAAAIIVRQILW
jgi:hypothetical protein